MTEQQRQSEKLKMEEADVQEQQLAALENMVKQKLSKEALERYGNFKLAFPNKAPQVLLFLGELISKNNIEVIEDGHLKELLRRLTPQKREMKISRK